MNKRFIVKHLPAAVQVVEKLRVAASDWEKKEPIFIYQFGKVGSSTVYRSLKACPIQNPIYHVHYLTREGAEGAVKFHLESDDPVLPHHLILSRILSRRISRTPGLQFKVVSLVRDPVDRAVSSAFENILRFSRDFVRGNAIDLEGLRKSVLESLASPTGPIGWVEHWLKSEMEAVTGINLLQEPFDPKKGWSINTNDHVSVLLIKVENLTEVFSEAMSEFLNIPRESIRLINTNVGGEKWYADAYKEFKDQFSLPDELRRKIYSSSYIQKFYPKKVEELVER